MPLNWKPAADAPDHYTAHAGGLQVSVWQEPPGWWAEVWQEPGGPVQLHEATDAESAQAEAETLFRDRWRSIGEALGYPPGVLQLDFSPVTPAEEAWVRKVARAHPDWGK